MATMECTKCGKTFERKIVMTYGGAYGWGGFGIGAFGLIIPFWPLVLKVNTRRPICDKLAWVKVLKPGSSLNTK